GDHGAQPQRVDLGGAGVLPGLLGGDQRELLGAVEPAQPRAREELGGVLRGAPGDADGQLLGPLLFDGGDSGPAFEEGGPGRGDVTPQRGGGAQASDDDFGVAHRPLSPFGSRRSVPAAVGAGGEVVGGPGRGGAGAP